MDNILDHIFAFYDMKIKSADNLNDDNDAFMLTDHDGKRYFLKIYGKDNDYDIVPGERVYHTYGQIQTEMEILSLLSGSPLKTAAPVKNNRNEFITVLKPDARSEPGYAAVTSFIDGLRTENSQPPTLEMAYAAGVSAGRLHSLSERILLPAAVKRPHKRQVFIEKTRNRLAYGVEIKTLSTEEYKITDQCIRRVLECMDELDKDPLGNLGLVHTDIISGNIIYTPENAVLVDFSRSVYSYYMYDLAEMCFHSNFGGTSTGARDAILRGYNSVKPLKAYDLFAAQALFVMFLLAIMAFGIDGPHDPWRDHVLKWFADEVLPGLNSGKGYIKDISLN